MSSEATEAMGTNRASELRAAIMQVRNDTSLSAQEKAKRIQVSAVARELFLR